MVNLLASRTAKVGSICLDAEPGGQVEARIATLADLVRRRGFEPDGPFFRVFDGELEELAESPSRVAALALLVAIDGLRRERVAMLSSGDGDLESEEATIASALPGAGSRKSDWALAADRAAPLAGGDWVCHRPGRSLATGEAEIASRGYFDVEDRPPIGAWIALLVPASGADEADALGIAAWVEAKDVERARAGCRACPNGAVAMLSEQAPEILTRLRAIEARFSRS